MIVINKYPEVVIPLYSPDEKLVGWVNQNEFLDVRIQICQQKLYGYYVEIENKKYGINTEGRMMECLPDHVFGSTVKLARQLQNLTHPFNHID
jgi:hypothetical protein